MESYHCMNSKVMEFRMFLSSPGSMCAFFSGIWMAREGIACFIWFYFKTTRETPIPMIIVKSHVVFCA